MHQKITGFHKDHEDHWVAELECGHAQHVRHDPPFFDRRWVTTQEGRDEKRGETLNCVRCDEMGLAVAKVALEECRKALMAGYEDAGISGLCGEGRWEAALGSLARLSPEELSRRALSGDPSKGA